MVRKGFTLVEILVVIAIIAVIAAILFPVFSRAMAASKATDCRLTSANLLKVTALYVTDYDSHYPQSRKTSGNPWAADADGSLEEPDYGSIFPRLAAYNGGQSKWLCRDDPDPTGRVCESLNPDVPELGSYLYNGGFAFGLIESGVARPSETILFSERRSQTVEGVDPFCNYLYRPWFNESNSEAPEDDMHATAGAVATLRHINHATYGFADGHVKILPWVQTFDLTKNLDLHRVN